MTKKTFLKRLETKLESLEENRRSEIIKKYELIIDEEKSAGKLEKEIVDSLGDIDLIAKIYINDKIENVKTASKKEDKQDEKKEFKTDDDSIITESINGIIKFFDDIFDKLDEKVAKRILLLLCFIAVGLAVISILHIPFRLVEVLGLGIFRLAFNDNYFYHIFSTMWTVCISVSYIVFVVWLAVRYINEIVMKYSNVTKPKKDKVKADTKESSKKENKVVQGNAIYDIFHVIIKVIVILLTIPFLTAVAGLFMALLFVIFLILNGVSVYGAALLILGMLIMFINLLDLIYTSIFKGGLK